MAKSEIYSWRLDPQTKMALEAEARAEGASLADLLDQMAQEWLRARKQGGDLSEEARQARLHTAAAATLGTISGDNPHRAENARELIRRRLHARTERSTRPSKPRSANRHAS